MFHILVVLYKKNLSESETLQGLLKAADVLNKISVLHVWDNSPQKTLSENERNLLNGKLNFRYTHCPENKPLSFVYNEEISFLKKQTRYKYLILFDDDSNISSDYFIELHDIIKSNFLIDIIFPLAISKNTIISPAKLFLVKGNYFKKPVSGIYNGNLLAVNSGMAISVRFLKRTNFKYNETLKNYGTDNYLMNFANKQKALYYIMHFRFIHNYSFYNTLNNSKRIEIFKQIKHANKIAFSDTVFQSFFIGVYNIIASFKNAVKYKSLKYLSN